MENIEDSLENQVENSEVLDKELVERYVEKKIEFSKMRPANTRNKDSQSAANLSRVPRFGHSSFQEKLHYFKNTLLIPKAKQKTEKGNLVLNKSFVKMNKRFIKSRLRQERGSP